MVMIVNVFMDTMEDNVNSIFKNVIPTLAGMGEVVLIRLEISLVPVLRDFLVKDVN